RRTPHSLLRRARVWGNPRWSRVNPEFTAGRRASVGKPALEPGKPRPHRGPASECGETRARADRMNANSRAGGRAIVAILAPGEAAPGFCPHPKRVEPV